MAWQRPVAPEGRVITAQRFIAGIRFHAFCMVGFVALSPPYGKPVSRRARSRRLATLNSMAHFFM